MNGEYIIALWFGTRYMKLTFGPFALRSEQFALMCDNKTIEFRIKFIGATADGSCSDD